MDRKHLESLVLNGPRNDFERREHEIIKELFAGLKDNLHIEIIVANLIIHYRAELARQHFVTLAAADALPENGQDDPLEIEDVEV